MQIKRPDPHTPEHHGDAEPASTEPKEEINLVSEPAACPFCVQPEFGVTYEPPPFRRGLVYNIQGQNPLGRATSAMSSTSSLNSPGIPTPGRRRATSLAVNDKTVVTTDMVRPDWAKKLADARAHALRRAAAATALHNAAYMMGNIQQQESRFGLGRRRRNMFGTDSAGSSGVGTPRREGEASSAANADGTSDLFPSRLSSRRGNRLDDLEELMMMEAIRLSLAAEEDRKRKDEKDAAKEAKKEGKKKAKEIKKVAKAQRHIGSGFHPIEVDGIDDTGAGSSSAAGKGKEIDRSGAGSNSLTESMSANNPSPSRNSPQKHLEDSRAQFQRDAPSTGNLARFDNLSSEQPSHRAALRNLSEGSSSASSFAESYQNSLRQDQSNNLAPGSSYGPSPSASGVSLGQDETPNDTPGTEPMFNFKSLTDAITSEDGGKDSGPQFIEDVAENSTDGAKPIHANGKAPEGSTKLSTPAQDPLGESVQTLKPFDTTPTPAVPSENDDGISLAPRVESVATDHTHMDQKHIGEVDMLHGISHQATQ